MARWLSRRYAAVTRPDRDRLNRVQALAHRVAAVAIRGAAFVMCPGDDIAAAMLPAVQGWSGDADHGHVEHQAILPDRQKIVVRLPLDRDGGGPDPDTPADLPESPADPASYDLNAYQHFVLEGVAAPGSPVPEGSAAGTNPATRAEPPERTNGRDR